MKLQLTLDHGKYHEILKVADLMDGHIDVFEIGFPMIITFGLGIVEEIRKQHPDMCLCVDAKVFHGGTGVTTRCFEAGANIVTVLSEAPDPVIAKMVEKAKSYGGQIMCDMASSPRKTGKRTAEVDQLGVDYIMVPSGFIPEYDYDIDAHRRSFFRPKVRPLDLAGVVKRNLLHSKLAIHTGINETNIRDVVALNPEIVLVGHAIFNTDDWVTAADRLKRYMPFEG